jgi:hypothetical protein
MEKWRRSKMNKWIKCNCGVKFWGMEDKEDTCKHCLKELINSNPNKITKEYLHKLEMELVNLCEDNEIMKEAIIDKFTNLINEVEE